MINFDDFSKVELRVAKVLAAERVEGSEKLMKLQIDLGDDPPAGGRQLVAGIAKVYQPEDMVGRNIVVVANLEPRELMGVESQGMLLAATDEEGNPVLLQPEGDIHPGAGIK